MFEHFKRNQKSYEIAFWAALLFLFSTVNATSIIIDHFRNNNSIPTWEPLLWEYSSALVLFVLILPLLYFDKKHPLKGKALFQNMAFHFLFTFLYVAAFIVGIIVIREWFYNLKGLDYDFGPLVIGYFYEYRKIFLAYLAILFIVYTYRFIFSRLEGEAKFIAEGENSSASPDELLSHRFLVKKLGKEFIVNLEDVDWIGSAGNYVNLHVGERIYPLRQTMTHMQNTLPKEEFIRIHRSSMVKIEQIFEITNIESGDQEIKLKTGKVLRLSRRYKEQLKSVLSN